MSASAPLDRVSKRRYFPVPRERLYRAWTVESELAAWWRPGPYRAESVRIELRVGGKYEIAMVDPSGCRQRLTGEYVEISAPLRLVMTWRLEGSPADDGYEALLTLIFNEAPGGGTLLELTHEKLRPAAVRAFDAGWDGLLPKLGLHLEAMK